MPLFVDAFDSDTGHLSLEEDGAYNRLLRLCWKTADCSVPNDPAWIARKMRLTDEAFARIVGPIINEFFEIEKGRIFQKRQRKEFAFVRDRRARLAEAGKKGGDAKSLKEKDTTTGEAMAKPANPPTPTPTPTEVAPNGALSEPSSDRKRTRKPYPDDFEAAWAAYPTHRNMSKAEALVAWNKLSKDDKASVLPSIPGYVAYLRTKPDLETIHFCRYLSKRRFEGYAATEGATDPGLVSLDPDHPDFKAVERLRGGSVAVGNSGKGTFTQAEIDRARRHAAEPDLLEARR